MFLPKKIRTNVIFGPFAFVVSVKQPQRMHEPPTWRRQKYFWDVTFFACFQDIISVFFFTYNVRLQAKNSILRSFLTVFRFFLRSYGVCFFYCQFSAPFLGTEKILKSTEQMHEP